MGPITIEISWNVNYSKEPSNTLLTPIFEILPGDGQNPITPLNMAGHFMLPVKSIKKLKKINSIIRFFITRA